MKSHVTPKQLQEIDEEVFYSLFDKIVKRKDWCKYHHKKMDIAKMIEILKYLYKNIDINITDSISYVKIGDMCFSSNELCNALWTAVVFSLKNR